MCPAAPRTGDFIPGNPSFEPFTSPPLPPVAPPSFVQYNWILFSVIWNGATENIFGDGNGECLSETVPTVQSQYSGREI